MNIKSIGPANVINYYNKVGVNRTEKLENAKTSDRIEISKAAKILNDYGIEDLNYNNEKKIREIKNKISNGTYNIDAKLTAQSMLDVMKGQK